MDEETRSSKKVLGRRFATHHRGGVGLSGSLDAGATLLVVHMHSWLPLTWPACTFNDVLQSFLMDPHLLLLSPSGSSVRIKLRDVCARYKGGKMFVHKHRRE